MERALITGGTGQIAAYLAQHLIDKGIHVFLSTRGSGIVENRFWRLKKLGIQEKVVIVNMDLNSYDSIDRTLNVISPNYIFHAAASSYIGDSFKDEFGCFESNFAVTHRLLDLCFQSDSSSKFIFFGSSEQFGNATTSPQDETTAFRPRNAYGIAKTASFELVKFYREHHKRFACSAILFNQESPLRDPAFVSRKISLGVVQARLFNRSFSLGSLDATRDWSHARDTVEALYLMAKQDKADDFVLASGINHSVGDFLRTASVVIHGSDQYNWNLVKWDHEAHTRPIEAIPLVGNPAKARTILGWSPKISFDKLVTEMVESDWDDAKDMLKEHW